MLASLHRKQLAKLVCNDLAPDAAVRVLHVAIDQRAEDNNLTEVPAEAQLQQLHAM